MQKLKVVAAIAAVLAIATPALALPPPGTDMSSPEHAWWECQKQNGTGISCCSVADGHVLNDDQWRKDDARNVYQALIDGHWRDIDPKKIVQPSQQCGPEPNAEHRTMAKVWFSRNWYPIEGGSKEEEEPNIYCFMVGTEY